MRNRIVLASGLIVVLVGMLVITLGSVTLNVDTPTYQATLAERVEHDPIIINNNTDFLAQKTLNGWTGTGEAHSPITIADYRIEFTNEGITLRNVDLFFAIENCQTGTYDTQYWGSTGIKLVNCSNGLINNCDADMMETGIFIKDSSHITVNSTTVHDCFTGVTVTESSYIILLENNLGWNDWIGINMTLTQRCTAIGNNIVSVPDYGIWCILDTSTYLYDNLITSTYLEDDEFHHIGIFSWNSVNFAMHLNDVYECGTALYMSWTDGAWVWDCTFANTTEYGVYLDEFTYNVTIIENYLGPTEGENGYDDGVENSWDDSYSEIGNCWSDYSGSGYYYINGTAGSIDHYPNGFIPTNTTTITTTTSPTTTTSTNTSTDIVTNDSTSTTTNDTVFEIPSEVLLYVSIGSASIIVIVVIVIIRGKP